MATKDLRIAGNDWLGIDRLQIPTTDSTKQNPIKATFYDTSDAATDETIKQYLAAMEHLKVYGQNGYIEGGEMPKLDADNANKSISDAQLQMLSSTAKLNGKIITISDSKSLLEKFNLNTNGDLYDIEVSFNTALDLAEEVACSAIQLENSAGDLYIYYKKTGSETFTLAYSGNDQAGNYVGWQGEAWGSSSTLFQIQLTEEPVGQAKTDLLNISIIEPEVYYTYVKTSQPVYIDAPLGETIFAIPGLNNLLPENVKFGTKITGIKIDGYTFTGTLEAANINRLSDAVGSDGYTTLVIE